MLDESDGAEANAELPTAVPMPHFLMREPDENVTAAERGTAMHTFMQFFDFESVKKSGLRVKSTVWQKIDFVSLR